MRAVLFDMDGVLFDSERAVLGVWKEVAAQRGLAGIETVFFRCVGVNLRGTREILLAAYPGLDFEDFDARVRARFGALYGGGRLPVKPGAREILTALRERGIPLALASSTRTEAVRRELGEAGLLDFFKVVVGGDKVARSKPDPEVFLTAAEMLGVPPELCLVVEDAVSGAEAGRAGGMKVACVGDAAAHGAGDWNLTQFRELETVVG